MTARRYWLRVDLGDTRGDVHRNPTEEMPRLGCVREGDRREDWDDALDGCAGFGDDGDVREGAGMEAVGRT